VHRNELRLLKLVNTLLDFSRIEAGRVSARFEATDLAGADPAILASAFRSAMDRARPGRSSSGVRPLPEPVYVDREMWEKVVLNLLSNAFKFTFHRLGRDRAGTGRDGSVELRVKRHRESASRPAISSTSSTGFHRIEHVRGPYPRRDRGSGLALVREAGRDARRHDRGIEPRRAEGTDVFRCACPAGSSHLPENRIGGETRRRSLAGGGSGRRPYVEEALRWLPADGAASRPAAATHPAGRPESSSPMTTPTCAAT